MAWITILFVGILIAVSCGGSGSDSSGSTTGATTNVTEAGGGIPVTGGLVATFLASAGVEVAADGSLASWENAEGTETLEPVSATNAPRLVAGAVNGRAVVRFNGNLPVGNPRSGLGLPTGDADRTLVVVGTWGGGMAGAGWGAVDVENGYFFTGNVNRTCRDADFLGAANWPLVAELCGGQEAKLIAQGTKLVGEGVSTVIARVSDGELGLFLGDDRVGGTPYEFATTAGSIWIGPNPTPITQPEVRGTMDVLAVLVYDRALDDAEVASLVEYLSDEYGAG
jgi:hypothetical protein